MTPLEIAQSLNNSKAPSARVSVNQDLAEAATDALNKAFKASGHHVGNIAKSALVEVALLSMLEPDVRKEILVGLNQNKIRDAYMDLAFEKSTLSSGDSAQKLEMISQLTRRLDGNRKPTDRTLQTILYTQAVILRYMLGDPSALYDPQLADGKLSEVMDTMYSHETNTLATELTRQMININNRNKRAAQQ